MNASSCPACGDQHLCPGSTSHHTMQPSDALLVQVGAYVRDTFEPNPVGVVSSQAAYEEYRHWCMAHGHPPYSNRRFVAAMAMIPGIRRIKRSTMRLAGITWKRSQERGRHAADEPAYSA